MRTRHRFQILKQSFHRKQYFFQLQVCRYDHPYASYSISCFILIRKPLISFPSTRLCSWEALHAKRQEGPLIDWWFDWLVDWLINWLTDWLIDWLVAEERLQVKVPTGPSNEGAPIFSSLLTPCLNPFQWWSTDGNAVHVRPHCKSTSQLSVMFLRFRPSLAMNWNSTLKRS